LRTGRPKIPMEWCVDGFDFLKHTNLVLKITNPKTLKKKKKSRSRVEMLVKD
jgi:hypothetical protein